MFSARVFFKIQSRLIYACLDRPQHLFLPESFNLRSFCFRIGVVSGGVISEEPLGCQNAG